MDESAVSIPARPKSTLGSLVTAGIIGALIAITLLYMWGARIAEEKGTEVLQPSTERALP
ncbi:MAG TPA: hypothetical protein PK109_01665 [Candidatus Paceibacterota bacterium]|nr:hypothetical protein [Candidatus Paceibacterota bacterium]